MMASEIHLKTIDDFQQVLSILHVAKRMLQNLGQDPDYQPKSRDFLILEEICDLSLSLKVTAYEAQLFLTERLEKPPPAS